eukprot:scaffold24754_cov135-Isochrysis_galbana.AAC.2
MAYAKLVAAVVKIKVTSHHSRRQRGTSRAVLRIDFSRNDRNTTSAFNLHCVQLLVSGANGVA